MIEILIDNGTILQMRLYINIMDKKCKKHYFINKGKEIICVPQNNEISMNNDNSGICTQCRTIYHEEYFMKKTGSFRKKLLLKKGEKNTICLYQYMHL